jgi:hypothetical protein
MWRHSKLIKIEQSRDRVRICCLPQAGTAPAGSDLMTPRELAGAPVRFNRVADRDGVTKYEGPAMAA